MISASISGPKGKAMTATSKEQNGNHGDNPGVGGMPAGQPQAEEDERNDPRSQNTRSRADNGDNPGVGGMPADNAAKQQIRTKSKKVAEGDHVNH
jgi:hypothetical protein